MNEAIQELGQQLDSADPEERRTSALELAQLEDQEAVPFLLRALTDKDETVRRWGAFGLAKLGRPEHAPALRRALEKDPSPRVQVQAASGLAQLGEKGALEKLCPYLVAPSLEVRWDAAEALLLQPDPAPLRPLLKPLLNHRDERGRAWVSGVLHSLGEPEAFSKWHAALASPESRRDAVLVVPLMQEARAVREILRLLAELSHEDLQAQEGEEPPLLAHLIEALRLSDLDNLLGDAATDEALRADLFVVLGRHHSLIREFAGDIVEVLAQRPPDKLGREVGQLVAEQDQEERGRFFTRIARYFPSAALAILAELKGPDREAVLQTLLHSAQRAKGEDRRLLALCEALRATPYGARFEGLPMVPTPQKQRSQKEEAIAASPTIEIPAVRGPSAPTITQEMELLTQTTTQEVELPEELFEEEEEAEEEEEEEWNIPIPPEAEAVAQRALVLGGLLRRLVLEERLARGKDAAAKEEILRLQKWMDEEGLFATLGITGMELLEAEPGAWSEEDRQSVAWSAEELQLLFWAMKQGKLPPVEARAEVAPLLERLPLLKDPQPFLGAAELRPIEEVEAQRDRWEALLECARYESFARGIASDPTLAEGDPDLEMLLESAEEAGFDRKGVSAKQGKPQAAVEGLRHWSRHLVTELQEQGLLPGNPGEGLTFQGKRLPQMDEPTLAALLALAHGRFQALEWLAAGGEALPEGEDEAG